MYCVNEIEITKLRYDEIRFYRKLHTSYRHATKINLVVIKILSNNLYIVFNVVTYIQFENHHFKIIKKLFRYHLIMNHQETHDELTTPNFNFPLNYLFAPARK